MSAERIAFIGAGSARFAGEMTADLTQTPGLSGSELVLHDVDEERLDIVRQVGQRLVEELGVDIRISSTTDRRAALDSANFVINSALAGGRGQMEREREAMEKLGIFRGIGLHAPYRQLSLMESVAKDISEVTPNATLMQVANPIPEGMTLMEREHGINVIGLCEGPIDWKRVAGLLGMNPELCQVEAAGLNHNIWMLKFTHDGKDAYPDLDEWIENVSEKFFDVFMKRARNVDYQLTPVAVDLYKKYGVFPLGDTCRAYKPETWWYHQQNGVEVKSGYFGNTGGFDGKVGAQNNLNWLSGMLASYKEALSDPHSSIRKVFMHDADHGPWDLMRIIDAISNDVPGEYTVNVPNRGAIAKLPDDFAVEVPVVIDGKGVHRKDTIELPEKVFFGAIIPHWLQTERIVQAHRSKDIGLLWQTFMADHKITSLKQAAELVDTLLNIPGNEEMLSHYGINPISPYTQKSP